MDLDDNQNSVDHMKDDGHMKDNGHMKDDGHVNSIEPSIMEEKKEEEQKLKKNIDILFYGTKYHEYRNNMLEKVVEFANKNNLIFEEHTALHGAEKDVKLDNTKIVVHVPSHANLHTQPWAKITELIYKKVFFIIEENEDMFELNLNKTIAYYKHNDEQDLFDKITYFLDNEDERNRIVDELYEYAMKTFDHKTLMDKIFSPVEI